MDLDIIKIINKVKSACNKNAKHPRVTAAMSFDKNAGIKRFQSEIEMALREQRKRVPFDYDILVVDNYDNYRVCGNYCTRVVIKNDDIDFVILVTSGGSLVYCYNGLLFYLDTTTTVRRLPRVLPFTDYVSVCNCGDDVNFADLSGMCSMFGLENTQMVSTNAPYYDLVQFLLGNTKALAIDEEFWDFEHFDKFLDATGDQFGNVGGYLCYLNKSQTTFTRSKEKAIYIG